MSPGEKIALGIAFSMALVALVYCWIVLDVLAEAGLIP